MLQCYRQGELSAPQPDFEISQVLLASCHWFPSCESVPYNISSCANAMHLSLHQVMHTNSTSP